MLDITYEAGYDEALHPDKTINDRMMEVNVSDCTNGCKVYWDPKSFLMVLGHNASYGCRRDADDIRTGR